MSKRLFIKQLLVNPRAIGAALPSSRRLAHHMAACVPHQFVGSVIELGPGTGVVTEALLKKGISPERIIAVEYSMDLIQHLRTKYPEVAFVHGDAAHLCELFKKHGPSNSEKVEVIVSSLPLKSLPEDLVKTIVHQMDRILTAHGKIIQFTYDLRSNTTIPFPGFCRSHSKIIWQNIPPARVSVFERKNGVVGRR